MDLFLLLSEYDMDPKRQKLHQSLCDNEKTHFLSMNNDCICKIFEWLHLDDICSLSDTCKRLKILASDYFERKHGDKLLHGISITTINGKIQLQPNEKCVWSFSRCFDVVVLNVTSRSPRDINLIKSNLSAFVRKYCSEYLCSILFQSMFLHNSIGDSIGNVLQNVETVVFTSCDLEGDYHEILKHLTVGENYGQKIEKLLLETYPKLEHFNCRYYGRILMTNNLKQFLQQHPNLKRLTWCFHARIRETAFSDKTLECIQIIVKNGKKLQELFLSFDGIYNLEAICGKLKTLCDRNHFNRLELDFRYTTLEYKLSKMLIEHGQHLTSLKSLSGLHLYDFSDYGSSFLPTLSTLSNLRILQLDSATSIKRSRLSSISLDGLSCLEQLHIGTLHDVSVAQRFICHVKSLKLVSVFSCKFNISRFDLPMMNLERNRLNVDSKLTIYLNIDEKKGSTDTGDEVDSNVKIEFVIFEASQWHSANPFIRMTSSVFEKCLLNQHSCSNRLDR